MLKRIGFAGTFDPITKGHLWVIGEAEQLADEVIILIAHNNSKQHMFSVEQRKHIIEQSLLEEGYLKSRVEIVHNEYTATYAKAHQIDYLIRGIRSTVDFDYENMLQQANTSVLQGAKTLFVMPPRDLGSVSSSFVKSLIGPKGWQFYIKQFLTESAFEAIAYQWLKPKYGENMDLLLKMLFLEKSYNILTMDLIQLIADIDSLSLTDNNAKLLKEYYLFKEIFHFYENNIFIENDGKIQFPIIINFESVLCSEYIEKYKFSKDQLYKIEMIIKEINMLVTAQPDLIKKVEELHAQTIVAHYQ